MLPLLPIALAADHHGAGHGARHGDHATMRHGFDGPASEWAARFDDPARDAWQRPAELVAALQIAPGATVADVGAGSGYFNRHLAAAVGPGGKVVAIDVEPALVAYMAERAVKEATPQVEARLGQPDDPGLRPGEADLVQVVNTWHHIDARVAWATKVRAGVKEGGRLVVVDFDPAGSPDIGPPPQHRIAPAQVKEELLAAGWTFDRQLTTLPNQYVLVFRR